MLLISDVLPAAEAAGVWEGYDGCQIVRLQSLDEAGPELAVTPETLGEAQLQQFKRQQAEALRRQQLQQHGASPFSPPPAAEAGSSAAATPRLPPPAYPTPTTTAAAA